MGIDIIRSNLVLYIFVVFNTSYAYSQDCKLHRVDFEIIAKDYPKFEEDINSFYSSNYEYDIIYMKIKGGDPSGSLLTRYYLKENWIKYSMFNNSKQIEDTITVDTNLISDIFDEGNKGVFMEVCPFSTSKDTLVYLLKKQGHIFLKYTSAYPLFLDEEGICGFTKLINKIK